MSVLKLKKSKLGNYYAYYEKYYVYAKKKQHGGYYVRINKYGKTLYQEGVFTPTIKTLKVAKDWMKKRIGFLKIING